MSILNLRAVADAIRQKFGMPTIETHAAVLAVALIHPLTGAVTAYVDQNGALVTPSGSLGNVQIVTTSTPTTGGTVAFGTAKADELLNLTPAGTLATLTATFPTNANSRIGQRISISSTQIITALTLSASGLTLQGTSPTTLAANQTISYVKVAAITWKRTDGIASTSGQILTGPILAGATATGSSDIDLSGGTGQLKTPTGRTTISGALAYKSVNTAVAAAGSDNSGAGALTTAQLQHVSSDSSAKGVILPVGVAGMKLVIINDSATACKLYPDAGGNVNGATTTTGSVTIPASKGVTAICTAALTWIVFDLPAKSA